MLLDKLNLVIVAGILIIPMIPTFWAILDVPKRRFPSTGSKVIWFAAITILPCLGAVLYFLLMRRHTQSE